MLKKYYTNRSLNEVILFNKHVLIMQGPHYQEFIFGLFAFLNIWLLKLIPTNLLFFALFSHCQVIFPLWTILEQGLKTRSFYWDSSKSSSLRLLAVRLSKLPNHFKLKFLICHMITEPAPQSCREGSPGNARRALSTVSDYSRMSPELCQLLCLPTYDTSTVT